MSNRSAISVAAMFASILAGANFASVTDVHAQAAADNCLTAPKDKTPAGRHWYYRLDRGTKRQCWYLRDENDKSARAAPQNLISPTKQRHCSGTELGRATAAPGGAQIGRERACRTDLRTNSASNRNRPPLPNRARPAWRPRRHFKIARLQIRRRQSLPTPRAVVDSRDALAGFLEVSPSSRVPRRRRRTAASPPEATPAATQPVAGTGCARRSRLRRWQSSRHRCRCCSW